MEGVVCSSTAAAAAHQAASIIQQASQLPEYRSKTAEAGFVTCIFYVVTTALLNLSILQAIICHKVSGKLLNSNACMHVPRQAASCSTHSQASCWR
jgi:hypothetical protein